MICEFNFGYSMDSACVVQEVSNTVDLFVVYH